MSNNFVEEGAGKGAHHSQATHVHTPKAEKPAVGEQQIRASLCEYQKYLTFSIMKFE